MLILYYSGTLAASFGVFAGTAALFMFGEVPRVRRDILQKFPFLDTYYDRTIAPEDNVSSCRLYSVIGSKLWILTAVIALLDYFALVDKGRHAIAPVLEIRGSVE